MTNKKQVTEKTAKEVESVKAVVPLKIDTQAIDAMIAGLDFNGIADLYNKSELIHDEARFETRDGLTHTLNKNGEKSFIYQKPNIVPDPDPKNEDENGNAPLIVDGTLEITIYVDENDEVQIAY